MYLDRSEQGQNKDYKAAELKCLGKHKGDEQSRKLIMGTYSCAKSRESETTGVKWLWIN